MHIKIRKSMANLLVVTLMLISQVSFAETSRLVCGQMQVSGRSYSGKIELENDLNSRIQEYEAKFSKVHPGALKLETICINNTITSCTLVACVALSLE